jgi:hypothetical protein
VQAVGVFVKHAVCQTGSVHTLQCCVIAEAALGTGHLTPQLLQLLGKLD